MPGELDRVAPTVFPSQPAPPAPWSVRRRRRWTGVLLTGLLIVVAAAGGMLVREISRPTQRALPTLVGSSGDSARSLLTELGWLVERFDVRRNGTSAGEVLDMQPPAGTRLAAGETVVLEVSLGSERQSIPPGLVGVSLSEASRLLVDAGLVTGEVTRVNNEDVVAGVVLEVLRSGDTVPRGDAVDLLVSDGPLPRVVPQGLVGMMPADVVAELIALRLAPTMGEEHDEWVAAGRVSRVEPAAGTRVVVGDDVRVVISLGAAERAVPALEGLSLAAAESRLQVSGFRNVVVVGLPESTDGTPVDRAALVVVSQDPPPARRGMPDVEVTLVVGSG